MIPVFPNFKPLELPDRAMIEDTLRRYQPRTSELNFTNLYIWRGRYQYSWSVHNDNLVIISDRGTESFALQPVGTGDLLNTTAELSGWMRSVKKIDQPCIQRADQRFVDALNLQYPAVEKRDHFDYLYRRSSLVELAGNRYHSKRNHINALKKGHRVEFREIDQRLVRDCFELTERWCGLHRCEDDMNLLSEWDAVAETLANYDNLNVKGGVLLIDGKVEAFSFGEMLNVDTLLIHIEKANPEIRGSYAAVNQSFAETATEAVFVNREQDLGLSGLRQAKMSYYPTDLIKKYTVFIDNRRSAV